MSGWAPYFFCGDKALKAHAPVGVCVAHPGGLSVITLGLGLLQAPLFRFLAFSLPLARCSLVVRAAYMAPLPCATATRTSYSFNSFQLAIFFVFCQVSRRPAAAIAFVDLGGCVRFCSGGASAHFPPPLRVVLGPGLDLPHPWTIRSFGEVRLSTVFSVIRTACDDTFVLAVFCRRFFLSLLFFPPLSEISSWC